MKSSSLQQIQAALIALNIDLQYRQMSDIERLILTGRRRELIAAQWLAKRLLMISNSSRLTALEPTIQDRYSTNESSIRAATIDKSLQSSILNRVAKKLGFSQGNLTSIALEIDILQPEKKRELFYIILRQIEGLLDELRFSQVTLDLLPVKQEKILLDLWESVMIEFFGRYYTDSSNSLQIEIIPILLKNRSVVWKEIISKIPQVIELLNYVLFQKLLKIDNIDCGIGTQAAEDRADEILENLMINIANAVIQPLLDNFGDVEAIKSRFYHRRLLSSREIERFRNDLSWRYRINRHVAQPQAMFESRYQLFILTEYGIDCLTIYAPRSQELARLRGISLAIPFALETWDAMVPRLKFATTFIGVIIVYLLTEIIGRSIGLIGRGIIKGIGNIWQETNRSSKR